VPQIVQALLYAVPQGLTLPLVYNTNGYDSVEILKLLEGIIDIYLPDMKYGEDEPALQLSGLGNYVEYNQAAVKEMYRQTGVLQAGADGLGYRGLLVRHLVLSEDLAGSEKVFAWLQALDPEIPVSLMAQYRPANKAYQHPILKRGLTKEEYRRAYKSLLKHGLTGFIQDIEELDDAFVPDFSKEEGPFKI
jgi:putative pyruvate formate lyase activating enzyme